MGNATYHIYPLQLLSWTVSNLSGRQVKGQMVCCGGRSLSYGRHCGRWESVALSFTRILTRLLI